MKFITIYNSTNSWEICIIKNLLDQNNISYRVPEEISNNAGGIGSLGMSGMRVQVPKDRQEEAFQILKERGFS